MNHKIKAVLFDFDGVIMNTEPQYSIFWGAVGKKYFPEEATWAQDIKGSTLFQIFNKYFKGKEKVQRQIIEDLACFESRMNYDYVPGFRTFLNDLKKQGIKVGVVTSSNAAKMQYVFDAHPDFKQLFDTLLLAEHFTRSKPDPECYLLGAEKLMVTSESCIVFEDSFYGLASAQRAGMKAIALSTTNPKTLLKDKAMYIIDDFTAFSYQKMLDVI
jgi:HAD superfamily hydrolase (TIGR01509 family)